MAAGPSIDVSGWLEEQLAQASPDLLRAMVKTFAEALMGAEADAVCGAAFGERSDERRNTRNGYRRREWDTRAGSIDLAIPKLRQGSYFPDWLLERRRRAEAALVTVVARARTGRTPRTPPVAPCAMNALAPRSVYPHARLSREPLAVSPDQAPSRQAC